MRRGLLLFLLVCLTGLPARAILGETLKEISERNGKPEPQPRKVKNSAVWLIEGNDGQMAYNVTFDDRGFSIAEGIKPVRYAQFSKESAQAFIRLQTDPYRNSKTLRTPKAGEKYSFAGQIHTVGANETIVVDEANDFIIVWTHGAKPSIIAARSVMMR